MKFLPVAALTASMIWVMSASLKFGVMRGPCCCALAAPASVSRAARATMRAWRMWAMCHGRLSLHGFRSVG